MKAPVHAMPTSLRSMPCGGICKKLHLTPDIYSNTESNISNYRINVHSYLTTHMIK